MAVLTRPFCLSLYVSALSVYLCAFLRVTRAVGVDAEGKGVSGSVRRVRRGPHSFRADLQVPAGDAGNPPSHEYTRCFARRCCFGSMDGFGDFV